MSQTYFTILTNLGAALFAQATASGTQLKLTHLAIGDGNGNVPLPSPTQTQLINEVRRSAINTVYTDEQNENYIIVEQVIPPEEGGFYIRELGLFDDKGNLIAVGNCPPSYKPRLSEGSGRTQVINMVIMVDNTGTVELKIDASTVLATRKYVDDLILSKMKQHEESINHPSGTTKAKGMVKLSSLVDSKSEDEAATPLAVKKAYEVAINALSKNSGGTVLGETNFIGPLKKNGSDVVTTNSLSSFFPSATSGVNGYQKLANGFILMFGEGNFLGSVGESGAVLNFYTSFPNQCFCILAGDGYAGVNAVAAIPISKGQFRCWARAGWDPNPYSDTGFRYIAIGN